MSAAASRKRSHTQEFRAAPPAWVKHSHVRQVSPHKDGSVRTPVSERADSEGAS